MNNRDIVINDDVLPSIFLINFYQVDAKRIDSLVFKHTLQHSITADETVQGSRKIVFTIAVLGFVYFNARRRF